MKRKRDALKRRDQQRARHLIRPENADQVIDQLPAEEGDRLHALVCGDFVYADFLIRIVDRLGEPERMTISTLSLSTKNADALAAMLRRHPAMRLDLLLSAYFQSTSGEIFNALESVLVEPFPERFAISVGRNHAKVAIYEFPDGTVYVLESSANLRSSNNLENVSIFRERELADFHLGWMRELAAVSAAKDDA